MLRGPRVRYWLVEGEAGPENYLILSSNPTIFIPIFVLGLLSHSGLTPPIVSTPIAGWSQQLASETHHR